MSEETKWSEHQQYLKKESTKVLDKFNVDKYNLYLYQCFDTLEWEYRWCVVLNDNILSSDEFINNAHEKYEMVKLTLEIVKGCE